MALDFVTMQNDLLLVVGSRYGAGATQLRPMVKRALNAAASDLWHAHPWPERKRLAFLTMVAPYTTGTVTLTNGSTAVTGSGTTWTTAMSGRKIALAYDGAWYTFTRTGDTTGTLDREYQGETVADSAYVIYQDVYSLASGAESLLTREMVAHKAGYGTLGRLGRSDMETDWPFPAGAGVPDRFAVQDVSSGLIRVRFGALVPDSGFDIRYGYLTAYTEMSADADECVVPEPRRRIITHGALREIYKVFHDWEKANAEDAIFKEKVKDAIEDQRAETEASFQLGSIGSGTLEEAVL